MLKVGVTGGIGSGKTTVCKVFEALGIPVYYADDRAKWLMVHNPDLVHGIKKLFGEEAYTADGQLDRPFIARKAFGDSTILGKLNALVHPAVAIDGERWHNEQSGVPYTIKEAALLFESGSYRFLDRVITVYAPAEMRIRRVMERDGLSREAVTARMERQMPEEEKIEKADFVIQNDGSRSLVRQVWQIHRQITAEALKPNQ